MPLGHFCLDLTGGSLFLLQAFCFLVVLIVLAKASVPRRCFESL